MNMLFIALGLAAVVAIVLWRLLRKPESSVAPGTAKAGACAQDNAEKDALYELGMNPAQDGKTMMYALETCRHCRKTREFLDSNNVPYHLLYVDQYTGPARTSLMDKVRSYNPRGSFPTIIIPGGKVVVGYREQLLREALLHDSGSTT